MSKVCIGVKYCGGCNPRYDRAAFLEKVKQLCPEASFFPVWENRNFDAYIVINGCPSACADIKGLFGKSILAFANDYEPEKVAAKLKVIIEKRKL